MQYNEIKQKTKFSNLPDEGAMLEGVILEKKEKSVFIDLSPYGTGIVRGVNYIEAKNYLKNLQIGDKITAKIDDWSNEDGLVELSLKNTFQEKSWDKIKKLKVDNIAFPLLILEANVGGLIGRIENIQGFLPVSQLSTEHYPRVEGGDKTKILEKLKEFIGKELTVKVLDFDSNINKFIFSEKLVEQDKLKEIASKYKIGETVTVKITKIVDFGAFVKIEDSPLDGLIHISEIISDPSQKLADILKEGEIKKARITSIEDGKISLSLKTLPQEEDKEKQKIIIPSS